MRARQSWARRTTHPRDCATTSRAAGGSKTPVDPAGLRGSARISSGWVSSASSRSGTSAQCALYAASLPRNAAGVYLAYREADGSPSFLRTNPPDAGAAIRRGLSPTFAGGSSQVPKWSTSGRRPVRLLHPTTACVRGSPPTSSSGPGPMHDTPAVTRHGSFETPRKSADRVVGLAATAHAGWRRREPSRSSFGTFWRPPLRELGRRGSGRLGKLVTPIALQRPRAELIGALDWYRDGCKRASDTLRARQHSPTRPREPEVATRAWRSATLVH